MNPGPFAKVYRSLWDGTLGRRPEAWGVFVFMLAHCGAEGVVEMTPEAIAARSGLTLEAVKLGIEILEQPDPESRTPEREGRRIVRLDPHRSWGWQIVNHERYRFLNDAERAAAYRERKAAAVTGRHPPSRRVTGRHQAEAEAEGEHHTPSSAAAGPAPSPAGRQARARVFIKDEHPEFAAFLAAYPRRAARRAASHSFHLAVRRHPGLQAQQLARAAERYAREVQPMEARFVPYPARWLDEDRFLEHLREVGDPAKGPERSQARPMFTPEELARPSEAEKALVRTLVSEVTAKLSPGG